MGVRIIGAFLKGFTSKFCREETIFSILGDFLNYRTSNYMSSTVLVIFFQYKAFKIKRSSKIYIFKKIKDFFDYDGLRMLYKSNEQAFLC